ncbi:MAG: rhomboid family intramembrane serine protease [Candidatus Saccharibacteria bacterium]
MAFGFSPRYTQTFALNGIEKKHFIFIAIKAAHQVDWNISYATEKGFKAYSDFSFRSASEEISCRLEDENAIITSECTGTQLFDWGKNKKNIEEFISKFEYLKSKYTTEEIESQYDEFLQQYTLSTNEKDNLQPSTTKEKITGFFSIFKPTDGYYISPILININILVFILMVLSGVHFLMPDSQSLIDWGANFRPVTLEGQGWRLLTACFLHIGILHLLMNMYALVYIGLLLEPYLGKTRFLAAYLITGIASSLVSLCWHDVTISAGASGAIFGMYGVFLALLTTNVLSKSLKKALMTSILFFVGYNLMNGLKPDSGIDNAAHIGGLLSGLLIGYAMIPSLKKFENKTIAYSTISVLSVLLIVSCFIVFQALPNDLGKYQNEMQKFSSTEAKALELFKFQEGTPNEKILLEIKDKGIPAWNENIQLLDSLKNLDLPLPISTQNGQLRKYCEFRIKSYELIYKSIKENTTVYDMEINACNKEIESILHQLETNEK